MNAFIDRVRSSSRRVLWLETLDYTARLLMRGAAPWLDAAGFVAWQRKSRALLDSDVLGVPVARLAAAWISAEDDLRAAMRSKRRATYPLQQLLADPALREHLRSLVDDLRASLAHHVLALMLPAPRSWLDAAYVLAHGADTSPAFDADDAENAAVHVADFLRSFAGTGLDVVLLETAPEPTLASPILLDAAEYTPLVNLAKHYRWALGVRSHTPEANAADIGIDFVITPQPRTRLTCGVEIDASFWSGATVPWIPEGGFIFAQVPADAAPEQVLERLTKLRAT